MYEESHSLMDGKVHVYKRGRSRFWQCSTYMNGRNHRKSTKHESLAMAMDYAREWYLTVYVDTRRIQENRLTHHLIQKAAHPQHNGTDESGLYTDRSPYAPHVPRPYAPRPSHTPLGGF